ncbi:MAG: metallophosphoesterase [Phycisphaerales bacterium]|nr:metallophosphoesterase [Phycisphaerales bacterium]
MPSASQNHPSMRARFRSPTPPAPIEAYEVRHPAVPAPLDGLSVLHIADLHTRRPPRFNHPVRTLIRALPRWPTDLVFLTGDFMDAPGDERVALRVLRDVLDACRARIGVFGVFGNHDSIAFQRAARAQGGVRWLMNDQCTVEGIRLVGASFPEDLPRAMLRSASDTRADLTLGLLHYPTEVFAASEFNIPLCFAGHTHGGQVRLSPRLAPHTSSDLPMDQASGVLRVRQTLCCISRGLGEGVVEVRWNCPAQAPLYRLRRGDLPASPRGGGVTRLASW